MSERGVAGWCVQPEPHRWVKITGKHLHFAGYHLPPPDAPDPEWTYFCCNRCGLVSSQEPATPTPDDRDREVERIAKRVADYPWGMLLAGLPDEANAIALIEELRAGLRASGGTE